MSDILDVHHARVKAIVSGDLQTLDQYVSQDLTYTSPTGMVLTKSEVFAGFKAGTLNVTQMETYDINATVYGDAAVVTYTATATMHEHDEVVTGNIRASTTYIKQDGRWQLVVAHQTRIEE